MSPAPAAGTRSPGADSVPRAAPALAADAHKGDAGRLLCVCGSRTMPGAAILVARAAARAGAGLVRVGCRDVELMHVVPAAVPEAVLVDLSRAGAEPDAKSDDACIAGPGLGADERTRELVEWLVDRVPGPLVLDADALNVLAGRPERLAARVGATVITPHPGEAARLLGRAVPTDESGRAACARELAERSGAVAVLKGRGTVVAEPGGGRVWVNTTGNPGMATAGAGDVLAGILGAYLAQAAAGEVAHDPNRSARPTWGAFEAACRAVFVHGRAGDLAAERVGARGLIASDLVDLLPAAQREP